MSRGPALGRYQEALYAAERAGLGTGRIYPRLPEAAAYVDALVDSEWWFARWPKVIEVHVERRGAGATWACASHAPCGGTILVPQGPITQNLLLHELAHLCTPEVQGHGPAYVTAQLQLVRHELGIYAWAEYTAALRGTEPFHYLPSSPVQPST